MEIEAVEYVTDAKQSWEQIQSEIKPTAATRLPVPSGSRQQNQCLSHDGFRKT